LSNYFSLKENKSLEPARRFVFNQPFAGGALSAKRNAFDGALPTANLIFIANSKSPLIYICTLQSLFLNMLCALPNYLKFSSEKLN
jgi:hypothetical protein